MAQSRSRLPRLAETAVERARLTLVPRPTRNAPRMPFVALVGAVLLAGVIGLLLFNTHMQQASFKATALETRAAALHAQEQGLRMELDTLRDPQRVALRARSLGMVPVVNPAFLRLSDGTVLGEAVPATGADAQRITPRPTRRPAELVVPADKITVRDLLSGAPTTDSGLSGGTTEGGSTATPATPAG